MKLIETNSKNRKIIDTKSAGRCSNASKLRISAPIRAREKAVQDYLDSHKGISRLRPGLAPGYSHYWHLSALPEKRRT
jgi:hypothetical protein